MAALAICESLLLVLNYMHVLPESEIMRVLEDAAAANENAGVLSSPQPCRKTDSTSGEFDPVHIRRQNVAKIESLDALET